MRYITILMLAVACGDKDSTPADTQSGDTGTTTTDTAPEDAWSATVAWWWPFERQYVAHAVVVAGDLACASDPAVAVYCWPLTSSGEVSARDAVTTITVDGPYAGLSMSAPEGHLCVSDEYAGPGRGSCTLTDALPSGETNVQDWPVQFAGLPDMLYAGSSATIGDVNGDGFPDLLSSATDGYGDGVYAWTLADGQHYFQGEYQVLDGCAHSSGTYCAMGVEIAGGRLYVSDYGARGRGAVAVYDLPITGDTPSAVVTGVDGWEVSAAGDWAVVSGAYQGEAIVLHQGQEWTRIVGPAADEHGKGVTLDIVGDRALLAVGAKRGLSGETVPMGQVYVYDLTGDAPEAPVAVLDGLLGFCGYSLDIAPDPDLSRGAYILAGCADLGGSNPSYTGYGAVAYHLTW